MNEESLLTRKYDSLEKDGRGTLQAGIPQTLELLRACVHFLVLVVDHGR